MKRILIIGISGVTCGGKTTMATKLNQILPGSKIITQDDYFRPVDDPKHTWIPELNHINYDILSSLDMERLYSDVMEIVQGKHKCLAENKCDTTDPSSFQSLKELQKYVYSRAKQCDIEILIIEGFTIFNYEPLLPLFNLKYYFLLNKEECEKRRSKRVYDPPDCPGYFELCVWPEHLKQLEELQTTVKDIVYFSEKSNKDPLEAVLIDILKYL